MVVIPEITTRMFYIIIAAIGVIGLVVALIQIRRIRKGNKSVKFLAQELEQRKRDLVKMDMESKGKLSKLGTKPLAMKRIPNEVEKPVYHIENVRGRLNNFESTFEYQKVQGLLIDIESKKIEFENKEKKFEINEAEYRKRLNKFNRGRGL